MEYFLSKLNDREFESLAGDIISAYLNCRVEKFKAGRDGGVDGRFWFGEKEGVIQCKHYLKTGYQGLLSKLKSEEVNKVRNLNPAKYIFFTSVPLSRENKKQIFNLFAPFIKSESDVWGEDDITDFLSKKENQNIVEKNYKLWITSTYIFDILLHNATKGRSESTIKEIRSHNERYAITENHIKGAEILKKKNVIIISGEPGIGKTTLANNLALYYIANGFEFCDIEESISEAEDLFREKENKKIIFYCDDFLGSIMYDAVNNKRDSHTVKFINRIKSDKTKKFILTSRTNILTKAVSLSHQLQNNNIREDEFLLKIENLSDLDKAKILYNHIYHSNIDSIYIDEIYKQKRYKDIIRHKNFNPRIIEFITDDRRISKIKSEQYWNYIISKFENPEDIWRDYFQTQIDDPVRVLSFLTVFNAGKIDEKVLSRSYSTFKKSFKIHFDHTDNSFNAVRRLAVGSLLDRSETWDDKIEYSLFNPSIGDFILNTYLEEVDLVISILKSLGTDSSINFLNSLRSNNKISKDIIQQIQEELFNYFYADKLRNRDWDYLVLLSSLDIYNPRITFKIKDLIKQLSNNKEPKGVRLYELLVLLVDFDEIIDIHDFSFISEFIENNGIDNIDLEYLLELIKRYEIEDKLFFEKICVAVESYFIEALDEDKSSANIGEYLDSSCCNESGDIDFCIDYNGIKSELESILDTIVSGFNKELVDYVNINYSNIIDSINIDEEVNDYFSSYGDGYDEDEFRGASSHNDLENDIEAVFERN
ncbi:restriction endonuclease [Ancylomarina sp. DW003]|nr:restriction endonuclease [Ancylomarina sp. DW003]MDE5423707.1 restriction endonuclease [Ancylomarina sp. DW003]